MKHWIRLLCLPLFAIAASMVSAQNVTEISTVQQLKDFRDAVNAGDSYAGQTVKLTADLDLNGETWIPIGQEGTNVANSNKFEGTFDGSGCVIANFVAQPHGSDLYATGFFGITQNATIKNVILKNATVTGHDKVGGVAGWDAGNTRFENCKVFDSNITAEQMRINSSWSMGYPVGGIVGYATNSVIDGCTVYNTIIRGESRVGGIAGEAANCTLTDNDIVSSTLKKYYRKPGGTGPNDWLEESADMVSVSAVTGSLSETNTKTNTSTDEYVVQRGEGTFAVKFKTLEEAFASVPANGVETPVKLLASIEGEGAHLATLDEGKNVVLDMNGKTLSFIVNQDEDSYVILNKGTLTMKESTGLGGGISMGSTITLSESRISTIIKNEGTFTLESGQLVTLVHQPMYGYSYVAESINSERNASFTIKQGVLHTQYGSFAVNVQLENSSYINVFNMTGGVIEDNDAHGGISVYNELGTAVGSGMNISGGTITGKEDAIFASGVGNLTNFKVNISGGEFNGDVELIGAPLTISDGIFNGHVMDHLNGSTPVEVTGGMFAKDVYTLGESGSVTKHFVKGGLFKSKTYEAYGYTTNCEWCDPAKSLAEGYSVIENTDPGTQNLGYQWMVVNTVDYYAVCAIGDTKYFSVAEAVDAVPEDGTETTITMLKDVDFAGNNVATIPAEKNVVLDLVGKTITLNPTENAASQVLTNEGTLKIVDSSDEKNGKLTNSVAEDWTYSAQIITNKGTLTIDAGIYENNAPGESEFNNFNYAVKSTNASNASSLTINGGKFTAKTFVVDLLGESSNGLNFTMTGGEITSAGKSGITLGTTAGSKPVGVINISGGTITGEEDAIQAVANGDNSKLSYVISGGTFNGNVEGYDSPMTISDGTFNGHVLNLLNWKAPMEVTGGKFALDIFTTKQGDFSVTKKFVKGGVFKTKTYEHITGTTNCSWCDATKSLAEGYIVVDNTDPETKDEYPWTVVNEEEYNTVDLIHGEPYPYPQGKACKKIRYIRSFASAEVNHYRSWYVPFDYTVSEEDLEKFKFYKIHMIAGSDQAGEVSDVTNINIFITKVAAGTKLTTNRPYVIVPLEALTDHVFTAENIDKVYAEENGSRMRVETTQFNYDFYGTYREFGATKPRDWYALNKNGAISPNATEAAKLQSYVWALKVTPRDENTDYSNISFSFVEGDDTNQIMNYTISEDNEIEGIYTVNGMKVDEPVKGVNIIRFMDGKTKKIYVK